MIETRVSQSLYDKGKIIITTSACTKTHDDTFKSEVKSAGCSQSGKC